MSKPILYGIDVSPPVRAVLLTAKAINLDFEYKIINLLAGENRSEEYLKKNPQHTVPLLEDGDNLIWDSHAINAYLVAKYANDDALYPKDLYQRAVVDQRLHFDSGVLFAGALKGLSSFVIKNEPISQAAIDTVQNAYDFLEKFLEKEFVAGDHLTIADFSCVATLSTFEDSIKIDSEKFPKLTAWYARMQALPYYEEACGKGLAAKQDFINKIRETFKNAQQ